MDLIQKKNISRLRMFRILRWIDPFLQKHFFCSKENSRSTTQPNPTHPPLTSPGAESMLMFSPNELSKSIILRHYGRWHEMEVETKVLREELEDIFSLLNEKFGIQMLLKIENLACNGLNVWWCKSLAASHLRNAKIVCIWWMPFECLDLKRYRGAFYMINISVGRWQFLRFRYFISCHLLRWRRPNRWYGCFQKYWYPKMDGLSWKTLWTNGWFGGPTPIFGSTPIWIGSN